MLEIEKYDPTLVNSSQLLHILHCRNGRSRTL